MAGPRMMSVPFAIDPLGRVAYTEDPVEQTRNKVRMLVSTRLYERLMMPRYGVDLQAFLFDMNDDESSGAIQVEIESALAQWLPSVSVVGVTVLSTDNSTLAINLDYSVPTTTSSDPTVYSAVIEVGGTVVGA